jgi:hypothetical protein
MGLIDRDKLERSNSEIAHYLGVVIDNKDPEFRGRAKIRVFGAFDDIEDEDLPWSHQRFEQSYGLGGGSGRISVPKLGSVVHLQFNNGNYYSPEYKAVQELAPDLIDEIRNSYDGAHSLIYDGIERLKMYYTVEKGLVIDLKDSKIIIKNDNSILITHADDTASIELKGGKITKYADQEIENTAVNRIKHTSEEVWMDGKTTNLGHSPLFSAVCAEPLWDFLKKLAISVDSKIPATPGVNSTLASSFEQLATSQTVRVTRENFSDYPVVPADSSSPVGIPNTLLNTLAQAVVEAVNGTSGTSGIGTV